MRVSWCLPIGQWLSAGCSPRASSFYKRPQKWSMILPASQVNDFSISLEFLCGIPCAALCGDVEQRFKRFQTIYVVWRGCLSRHSIYNNFYVQFESQVFCLFLQHSLPRCFSKLKGIVSMLVVLSVRGIYRGPGELGEPFSKHMEAMDTGFIGGLFGESQQSTLNHEYCLSQKLHLKSEGGSNSSSFGRSGNTTS